MQLELEEILNIVQNHMDKHDISLTEYAELAGVSKAWLSRLLNDDSKNVSIEIAQRLLNVAGFEAYIKEVNSGITSADNTEAKRKDFRQIKK